MSHGAVTPTCPRSPFLHRTPMARVRVGCTTRFAWVAWGQAFEFRTDGDSRVGTGLRISHRRRTKACPPFPIPTAGAQFERSSDRSGDPPPWPRLFGEDRLIAANTLEVVSSGRILDSTSRRRPWPFSANSFHSEEVLSPQRAVASVSFWCRGSLGLHGETTENRTCRRAASRNVARERRHCDIP